MTAQPFKNQIATSPALSCHRISVMPSPLKSPLPAIDHLLGSALPTPQDWVGVAPFISHSATLPLLSCQRMSPLPSPLKSPVPAIDHLLGSALPTPDDCTT